MALRSLDNALPASVERPKKAAKVVASATASAASKKPSFVEVKAINDENVAPQQVVEQAVEYIASKDLQAIHDPQAKIKVLMDELNSKDWVKVCEALNDLRRMAIHHSSLLISILKSVMLVIVKAMKNPRSALCKTSIMASVDIFHSFGHLLLPIFEESAFDQLLLQLLLKASQDKRFVCEEAEKALETLAVSVPPLPLLKKLQSYGNHANLRVRAKTAVVISKCASNMDAEVMKEFGLATLLQMASELLNDRLPEAREAARSIIISVHDRFSTIISVQDDDKESPAGCESWQDFCSSNLPTISAQTVAKIVS